MWVSISNILHKKNNPFSKGLENGQLPLVWKNVVKEIHPRASAYTEYKNYYNNTLYIKVNDSIWIGELDGYREEFKKEINRKRKKPIYNIKFVLG